ncbi:MAG TPA: Wzz/FepE/Etk N-terminal domain-containing protein, partial [Rhodoblastus sp.]|nr:Wzz/FepE/Etk N-terminal domain-containing protein [Rhodoblastus sp.]
MMNIHDPRLTNASLPPADESQQLDVSRLISAVKRDRQIVYGWIVGLLAIATLYLLVATPIFKAEADIIIDTQTSRSLEKADLNAADLPAI